VKTSDFVLPDGQVPEIGSMSGQASVVFKMKPGDISGPINTGTDGAVISVIEVQAPPDTDYAAKRDQIREGLVQGKQQELFGLFITNLRDQMEKTGKIKINQDELKTLTRAGSEPGI
jgi:peptidyl-prolyl cis-trans isomerase D